MMLKRKIKIIVFAGWSFIAGIPGSVSAQSISQQIKLPSVLPPSPEAAAINKDAQLSVGLLTGAANASIPFCEIKMNGFTLPVGINYSANGMKVDEVPSRTGINWSLNAGGVISRIVHGRPDDQSTRLVKPSNLYGWNQQMYDYINQLADETANKDGEPDEYRFSGPGFSGKFIIADDGSIVQIPYSNLKIEMVGSLTEIRITNTEGIVFKYGNTGATERTNTHSLSGKNTFNVNTKTAFYLYRIDLPNGDFINLNYAAISTVVKQGITQTAKSPAIINPYPTATSAAYSEVVNSVSYNTYYLSSISTSDYQNVFFNYEARPDDSNDNRLKSVFLSAGGLSKTYYLTYTDPPTGGAGQSHSLSLYNERFFLKTVYRLLAIDDFTFDTIRHVFDYEDYENLPPRLSYSQDHYGFYNGKYNQNLLPDNYDYNNWAGSYATANRTPDANYAVKGMLKKITYPTGGNDQFEYVSNGNSGGVRVSAVSAYDPVTNKTTKKYYTYGYANTSPGPIYETEFQTATTVNGGLEIRYSRVINSNSVASLFMYNNSQVAFSTVTEADDPAYKNGGIEHQYDAYAVYGGNVLMGAAIHDLPTGTSTNTHGYETGTRYFNKNFTTVKEVNNYYAMAPAPIISYISIRARRRYDYSLTLPVDADDQHPLDANYYQYESRWPRLDSTVVKEYDTDNKVLKSKTSYTYGLPVNMQPSSIVTTRSTGAQVLNEKKYPTDYTTAPYTTMVQKNILTPVVEDRVSEPGQLLYFTQNNYLDWFSDGKILLPQLVFAQKGTNTGENRMRFHSYDNTGNVLEVSMENGQRVSYIWDYNNKFPVAETKNASVADVAYTSFEATGKGNWAFAGLPVNNAASFTGNYLYTLSAGSITKTITAATVYKVFYWLKNATGTATVNGLAGTLKATRNGWSCYEHLITGTTVVTIAGTGTIDELRLHPRDAQMVSYTYFPYVGINSICSPNQTVTYYEYDLLQRLRLIRDQDKNIIKQFDYKFNQTIAPCASTAAVWQATGTVRCVKNNPDNNNNTGDKEVEEKDVNNCSSSYLQKRWTLVTGAAALCPPVANCTGADKRVINGVCNTGSKIYLTGVYIGNGLYECTYKYYWFTDGYYGTQVFTEQSTIDCTLQ
jgi:hypothetical protein